MGLSRDDVCVRKVFLFNWKDAPHHRAPSTISTNSQGARHPTVSGDPAQKQGNIDTLTLGSKLGGWHRGSQESGTLMCKPIHLTDLELNGKTYGGLC